MHPQITTVFDDAENRYLKTEELKLISQYVASMPDRLDTYRNLRDRELEIMQPVVEQLQVELPQESEENLERSIKHALLMLRYCALSLLLNDEGLVQRRFLSWIGPLTKVHDTKTIDAKLYRLLNQQLSKVLNPKQMSYLSPSLALAQEALLSQAQPTNAVAMQR
jgi:Phycobilisome protein